MAQIINGLFVQLAAAFLQARLTEAVTTLTKSDAVWVLAFKENGIKHYGAGRLKPACGMACRQSVHSAIARLSSGAGSGRSAGVTTVDVMGRNTRRA